MAIYNTYSDAPQNISTITVGQFGPSHDTIQDWRSIFQIANQLQKLFEDMVDLNINVTKLREEAEQAIADAQRAVQIAEQVNDLVVGQIGGLIQEVREIRDQVSEDRRQTEDAEEEANKSATDALNSEEEAEDHKEDVASMLQEVQKIRDDLEGVELKIVLVDTEAEVRAEFNSETKTLTLYLLRVKDDTGPLPELLVKTVCSKGPDAQGNIKLTAADVGAIPLDGSGILEKPFVFRIDDNNRFEMSASKVSNKYVFRVLHNGTTAKGFVIDSTGSVVVGEDLYVKGLVGENRKKVFHEGAPPTAEQVGAYKKADVYTKTESDGRYLRSADMYNKTQIDQKFAEKLGLNPNDNKIYGRQGANWVEVAVKSDVNDFETRIAALEGKVAGFKKITASTTAPSGGEDGDVWLQYVAPARRI